MIESREAFFAKVKRKQITIQIPGTSEKMTFHALTLKDREDFVEFGKVHGVQNIRNAGFLIARSCDFFTDEDMEYICDSLSNTALIHLSTEILKISGLAKESSEEAEKK